MYDKHVRFNNIVSIYDTYSSTEYDRSTIMHELYTNVNSNAIQLTTNLKHHTTTNKCRYKTFKELL